MEFEIEAIEKVDEFELEAVEGLEFEIAEKLVLEAVEGLDFEIAENLVLEASQELEVLRRGYPERVDKVNYKVDLC